MADKLNGIFIAELLADNAGGASVDTDGDGNTNKSDEFIQLQSTSGTALSLDGFEIWSEKNGLLYSFGAGDTIGAGGTATVVGNYSGTPPADFYDGGVSEGTNWIPDGEGQKFDTIFLVDTNTGEYITLSYGDPPRTPTPPSGFPGTTQVGSGETIDSNAPNGRAFARDANGDLIETTPTPGTPDVPCFAHGTLIETEEGQIAVEDLRPGMRVLTKDAGFVSLRGVGCFAPTLWEMRHHPELQPIVFPQQSIGNRRPLHLSGAHRVLIKDPGLDILFNETEALASARSFVAYRGVHAATHLTQPRYFHLLFDRHEIIRAEGCWVESLFLGDLGMQAISQPSNWTFERGFDLSALRHTETARIVLKRAEAQLHFASKLKPALPPHIAA